jgi:serine protease Do
MKKLPVILILLLGAALPLTAQQPPPDEARARRITPTVKAAARVLPSVVNLSTERLLDNDQADDFFPLLDKRRGYSLGSGCIISESGLVVTSAHVVHNAMRINVTLHDGQIFTAEIIAADELNDIALLRLHNIPKASSPPIPTAAPGDLILGETVIAVGNPYGLGNTISHGVLSGIGRQVTYGDHVVFSDILQTDCAIHAGNSGGPLININGEMIGLTSSVIRGADGIGFAIPLQRLENILGHWLTPERFNNVSVGVIPGVRRMQDGELVFFVSDVMNDSPAWEAGIRPGLKLLRFNDSPITNLLSLSLALTRLKAGDEITLTPPSGNQIRFTAEKISMTDAASAPEKRLGLRLRQITPELARTLNYPTNAGLIVSKPPESAPEVKRGDILIRLGSIPIQKPEDIAIALRNYHYGDTVPALLASVTPTADGQRYRLERKNVNLYVK